MLREKTLGECILKVERAVVNDFPDLLKSFPVDFPLRASPLDRFYVRLGLLYSLQQKKQARISHEMQRTATPALSLGKRCPRKVHCVMWSGGTRSLQARKRQGRFGCWPVANNSCGKLDPSVVDTFNSVTTFYVCLQQD